MAQPQTINIRKIFTGLCNTTLQGPLYFFFDKLKRPLAAHQHISLALSLRIMNHALVHWNIG